MHLISSPFTWVHKRIMPVILGVVCVLATVGGIAGAIKSGDPRFFFITLLPVTIGAPVWWYVIRPLVDAVWLDEPDLVVRTGGDEVRIPLSSVDSVTASYFTNPERITLKLREFGPFGDSIVFLPPTRYFRMPFSTHPLADELRDLVRRHTYPELRQS